MRDVVSDFLVGEFGGDRVHVCDSDLNGVYVSYVDGSEKRVVVYVDGVLGGVLVSCWECDSCWLRFSSPSFFPDLVCKLRSVVG